MSKRSRILSLVAIATVIAGAALLGRPAATSAAAASNSNTAFNSFCSRLGHSIQASAAAQGFCNPPRQPASGAKPSSGSPTSKSSIGNVNAANPSEDITPSGARMYGQSEVSTAASGPYVVEAWNDATGFASPCPSAMNKEELTGFSFSSNNGASFTDLGGLPNDCTKGNLYNGDPFVEAFKSNGNTYFYIGSLYLSANQSFLAMDACQVVGSTLSCSSPIVIAAGAAASPTNGPDFLDKEYATIDPGRSRLYVSFTNFTGPSGCLPTCTTPPGNGQIELAVCDLSTTPGTPTCDPGSSTAPYLVVQSGDPNCEHEGAYPAVDRATGDVYVAWEFNWATNLFNSACANTQTVERLAFIPFSCLPTTGTATCTISTADQPIVSMDAALIPGYSRFPMNDFPRIAVSDAHGTVSIVWNDARAHVLGDIMLQSFSLGSSLTPVQGLTNPTRVNSKGAAHFLPALRYVNGNGNLVVAWYERSSGNTAVTSFAAANNVLPGSTSSSAETMITNVSTNWLAASSDINPNFGDYTDVYVQPNTADPDASTSPTNDDVTAYYAWSDGRSGVPQPYNAHTVLS